MAALVIAVALVKFIIRYFANLRHPHFEQVNQNGRIRFVSPFTIALELLLAADILATAMAPTRSGIGKLAAIAILRTARNNFLARELKETKPTNTAPAPKNE